MLNRVVKVCVNSVNFLCVTSRSTVIDELLPLTIPGSIQVTSFLHGGSKWKVSRVILWKGQR